MTKSPVKVFLTTFLMLAAPFLKGEEEQEPTLFVDSINLQVMTDLTISGKADPITILQNQWFEAPFLSDNISISFPESALSEEAEEAVKVIYHFMLENAPAGEYTFGAINRLQTQMTKSLLERGYYGIVVTVDPDQIDVETGDDYRREGDTSLNLNIWLGQVTKQRTVAKGRRIKGKNPINHPFHRKIIKNSPFYKEESKEGKFLIDKNALDNYLIRLNQNTRRRVDAALSSGGSAGEIILDYIVSESKPWVAYLQASNTGTEATGEWRERIGGVYYQVTNNDDVLSIDYLTAEFDRANAVSSYYEFPLIRPDYLKILAFFKYNDFAAENLEVPSLPDSFGETYTYGVEFSYIPFYWKEHAFMANFGFLDESIEFETSGGSGRGNVRLLSPYIRLEISKQKQLHRSLFSISYEENIDTSDDDDDNLNRLGRLESDIDHRIIKYELYQSFFIEPLLPSYYRVKPDKWLANSLVHELAFSLRGQEALDDARLITQKQFFGGGFFTVRGYDESAARGDSGVVGSVEYRIHLARLLRPASMLEEIDSKEQVPERTVRDRFNYRAPSLYGIPDWNFLVRGFFDWAEFTFNGEKQADETDHDLKSVGVGFEFQYDSKLNVRLDYGIVMKELWDGLNQEVISDADEGDSRFHFLVTYTF